MRLSLTAVFLLLAAPAFAGGWWSYDNPRFSYAIELPDEFAVSIHPDNGDGLALAPLDKSAKLIVFGVHAAQGDFSSQAKLRMALAKSDSWQVSYSKLAPRSVSFSGMRQDRILYVRGVALCNGDAAFFQIDYPKADMHRYDAVVMRLVRSLRPSEKCPGSNQGNGRFGPGLFRTG